MPSTWIPRRRLYKVCEKLPLWPRYIVGEAAGGGGGEEVCNAHKRQNGKGLEKKIIFKKQSDAMRTLVFSRNERTFVQTGR